MKRILYVLIMALSILCIYGLTSNTVQASQVYNEDIVYEVDVFGRLKVSANLKYMTTLNIPESINGESVTIIDEYGFSECKNLETVNLPDTIEIISKNAFAECTNLKNINLPKKLNTIGEGAFSKTKITEIEIPSSVEYIESEAFGNCNSLEKVVCNANCKTINGFNGCSALKTVKFSENSTVTAIGNSAFSGCTALKEITLPQNLTNIGSYAFSGCSNLKSIILPKELEKIEGRAFGGCSSLEKIVIPEKVKYIGLEAFSNCDSLKTITLPNGVEEIRESAFANCDLLESVDISKTKVENDTYIGKYAFSGCTSLRNVILPQNLKRLKENIFLACRSLTNVVIPEKVNYIEDFAFSDCSSLKTIIIPCGTEHIDARVFSGCKSMEKVYIFKTTIVIYGHIFGLEDELNYPKNVTICGFKDSAAEQYANEYNIKFEALTPVQSVSITGEKELKETKTIQLKANILPENASYKDVKWESSNIDIATVDENGVVAGLKAGKATILAISKDGTDIMARYEITVNKLLNFTDVHKEDYFYGSVVYTYENKIIKGKSDTIFAPYAALTRGELVTILYRMEGSPKIGNKNPFTDVKEGAFYYNSVIWASEKGIVSGYGNGKFGANDPIKRAQLATILYNYARYKKVDLSKTTDITTYNDYNVVQNKTIYALDAFKWAIGSKIMKGTDEGNINPTAYATRGQVAVMITNYCTKVKK